jgi:hypothetical protein
MNENEDLENIVRLDEIDEATPLIDQVSKIKHETYFYKIRFTEL